MTSYLIPYLDPKKNNGEEDPLFSEYTYGDKGNRGYILKNKVRKGDFLFFHTSIRNKRFITAFYEVEEVIDIQKARTDTTIKMKYRNPHLLSTNNNANEVIVFGNPVKSVVFYTPLEINKELLLELSIPFSPSPNQTELAALSSKFRNWFKLTDAQIKLLQQKVFTLQNQSYLKKKQLSSDEIRQLSEADIEQFLVDNPSVLGSDLIYLDRQYQFKDGKRLDLLLKNRRTNQLFIVEIKKGDIGPEVLKQIKGYLKRYEDEKKIKHVKGIIVCKGILSHFEDEVMKQLAKEKVQLFQYGWMFSIQKV
ncbi:endonuclease NucS [Neobacillus sp. WH10]|uniref:endonuclease NucS domain-containing protein n=1 Tax=Neobacillus sp. WH10 TaxID=3047873 RepID=UPI0024C18345|nr:endonuclease NucS domain-containing protein [Neobacillus sp. WH10]WHY79029.1 endonuclease NucS [Neobacillus sp. WH10]